MPWQTNGQMSDTYKAVFTCEAVSERQVWYVSSRSMADKMLYRHMHCIKGRRLEKYRGVDYTFTVRRMFASTNDVGYDSDCMGWGGN